MKSFFLILLFALTFNISFAQIVITEIMYDVDGSDSGREWIEIQNTGGTDINLADWKLYENKTNHGLVGINDKTTLSAGAYGIIAENKDKFLLDWPSFSGLLLDSSFSLKNTDGETITLRDDALTDIDTVSYDPSIGAAGDGNSLQYINNTWISSIPTPGFVNKTSQIEQSNTSKKSSNDTNSSVGNVAPILLLSISADAGGSKTVIAGADVIFKGLGFGTAGEPLQSARYLWNLGDGTTKEGQTISHVYKYPGVYALVLNVSSGKYTSADRVKITAEPANIIISNIKMGKDGFVELYNESKKDLNLSFWHLRIDRLYFTFPEDTYIFSDTRLIFPYETTNLLVKENSNISLLYPNTNIVNEYKKSYPYKGQPFVTNEGVVSIPIAVPTAVPIAVPTAVPTVVPIQIQKDDFSNNNPTNSEDVEKTINAEPIEIQAAIGNIDKDAYMPLYQWLLVLTAVTFLAIASVIYVRRKESTSTIKLAKQIKIIED